MKFPKRQSLQKFFGIGGAGSDPAAGSDTPAAGCGGCPSSPPADPGRRAALGALVAGVAGVVGLGAAASGTGEDQAREPPTEDPRKEADRLRFQEHFRKNYREMTEDERRETVRRIERLAWLDQGAEVRVSTTKPRRNVLYGYAFNVGKCQGYMDCIRACVEENNQDRDSKIQYIKIWEMDHGSLGLESANGKYFHEVPAAGHFYLGTQCFHCENPPCTKVCPVGATWKEDDGIVVVDYDWCIGCRYCEAACPYFGRRFNWQEPSVPADELNPTQHYLGNRLRAKGVMEKCTFCVQRSREGKLPACVEACPTGARVFGNLLDPESEIRYVLEHKKVFRLKEDLGTEPKFWYFTD